MGIDKISFDINLEGHIQKYGKIVDEINTTGNSIGWKSRNIQMETRREIKQLGREMTVSAVRNTAAYKVEKGLKSQKGYYIACQRDSIEYAKRHKL